MKVTLTISCEGRTIQQHLRNISSYTEDDQRLARTFNKLMFQVKVQAAVRLLSAVGKGLSLPLDSKITLNEQSTTVREELVKKHPTGQSTHGVTLAQSNVQNQHTYPVLFDCIDGTRALLYRQTILLARPGWMQ